MKLIVVVIASIKALCGLLFFSLRAAARRKARTLEAQRAERRVRNQRIDELRRQGYIVLPGAWLSEPPSHRDLADICATLARRENQTIPVGRYYAKDRPHWQRGLLRLIGLERPNIIIGAPIPIG